MSDGDVIADGTVQAVQKTLGGDQIIVKKNECQMLPGCRCDAENVLEAFDYNKGRVDVLACSGCTQEFLEYEPEEYVRPIEESDRYVNPGTDQFGGDSDE